MNNQTVFFSTLVIILLIIWGCKKDEIDNKNNNQSSSSSSVEGIYIGYTNDVRISDSPMQEYEKIDTTYMDTFFVEKTINNDSILFSNTSIGFNAKFILDTQNLYTIRYVNGGTAYDLTVRDSLIFTHGTYSGFGLTIDLHDVTFKGIKQ